MNRAGQPRRGAEKMPTEAISRYLEAFLEMLIAERGAAANTVASYQHDLADCARLLRGAPKSSKAVLDTATDAIATALSQKSRDPRHGGAYGGAAGISIAHVLPISPRRGTAFGRSDQCSRKPPAGPERCQKY